MKNVLITGGAGGIGREIVKKFINNGYFVYVVDNDNKSMQKLIELFGNSKFEAVNLDVTDIEAIIKYRDSLKDDLAFSYVITLAGRALDGDWKPFEEQSPYDIKKSIELNLLGHLNIIHAFLPLVKRAEGDKAILTVSSINGTDSFGLPAYSSAKLGLYGFTNAITCEFGALGIRINTLSPGTVKTDATEREPKDFSSLLKGTALGRFATREEVADLAYHVCNTFTAMTGQNIVIDAGQTKKHN